MGRVVVVGGGIVGLSTAMMLAKEGMAVTVLDQGEAPPDTPEEAHARWARRGISQFRQAHLLNCHAYQTLREQLPEVPEALRDAGAVDFNLLTTLPTRIEDRAPRPDDDKFDTLAVRRPVIEYAMANCASRLVDIRNGVDVAGLITGSSTVDGIPRVTGVRTSTGENVDADLVIDAAGRRTRLPQWLNAVGAPPPYEETEDERTAYYTRFFRAREGEIPPMPDGGLLQHFDSYSLICIPADREYWSVSVVVSTADQALKELHYADKWMNLIRACPAHVHLLDGEAEDGVRATGGNGERLRRFVVDGRPVATGVLAVGDALATTNPTYGRGMSMGLLQAVGAVDAVREHIDDPLKLALEYDNMVGVQVVPRYRDTVKLSQSRADQVNASINGESPQAPPSGADPVYDVILASAYDADFFRVLGESVALMTPFEDLLARPGLVERAAAVAKGRDFPAPLGPSRPELLKMLA